MPIEKWRLKASIKKALQDEANKINDPNTPEKSVDNIAEAVAEGVIFEIKSMVLVITGVAGNVPITITNIQIL